MTDALGIHKAMGFPADLSLGAVVEFLQTHIFGLGDLRGSRGLLSSHYPPAWVLWAAACLTLKNRGGLGHRVWRGKDKGSIHKWAGRGVIGVSVPFTRRRER